MNGKKAKALRKEVYGEEFSPRAKSYKIKPGTHPSLGRGLGQVVADSKRRKYQDLKREYSRG